MARTLLVYYSRTGKTKGVAEVLEGRLGCDVEEIRDTRNRLGIIGYLRSGFEASRGKTTRLQPLTKDPADYDLTIIGTPFWTTVSVPVRTYLGERTGRFRQVAFFATMGGSDPEKAFRAMTRLASREPVATMGWRTATSHASRTRRRSRRSREQSSR